LLQRSAAASAAAARKQAIAHRRNVMQSHESTIGILLAGGRATRMGGGDKAFKTIRGLPLLARVAAILRPQCDSLLVSANGETARFAQFGLPAVVDDIDGFAGPLAGILAGLDFIATQQPQAAFAVSVATDTPFLPADLVERLHAAQSAAGADIASARSGGATHPVITLWPIGIRTALRRALVDEGLRKVDRFMARYNVVYADWPLTPFDPFFNINEPDDLPTVRAITP
jgi:molybdopterin-guanine dinucleotide biosynthesis protein A